MNQAKKVVRKAYPYAASVKADPFYGWAILIASGENMALVKKQRDEEAAWIAAASLIQERERRIEQCRSS